MTTIRIKDLPNSLSQMGANDVIPVEDITNEETKKLTLSALQKSITKIAEGSSDEVSATALRPLLEIYKDIFNRVIGFDSLKSNRIGSWLGHRNGTIAHDGSKIVLSVSGGDTFSGMKLQKLEAGKRYYGSIFMQYLSGTNGPMSIGTSPNDGECFSITPTVADNRYDGVFTASQDLLMVFSGDVARSAQYKVSKIVVIELDILEGILKRKIQLTALTDKPDFISQLGVFNNDLYVATSLSAPYWTRAIKPAQTLTVDSTTEIPASRSIAQFVYSFTDSNTTKNFDCFLKSSDLVEGFHNGLNIFGYDEDTNGVKVISGSSQDFCGVKFNSAAKKIRFKYNLQSGLYFIIATISQGPVKNGGTMEYQPSGVVCIGLIPGRTARTIFFNDDASFDLIANVDTGHTWVNNGTYGIEINDVSAKIYYYADNTKTLIATINHSSWNSSYIPARYQLGLVDGTPREIGLVEISNVLLTIESSNNEQIANKNIERGYAGLDDLMKIPADELPYNDYTNPAYLNNAKPELRTSDLIPSIHTKGRIYVRTDLNELRFVKNETEIWGCALTQKSVIERNARSISYMALGDSITNGVGNTEGNSYSEQLKNKLIADEFSFSAYVKNGYNGATAASLKTTVDGYSAVHHDLVTLMIGTNDVYYNMGLSIPAHRAKFKADLEALYQSIKIKTTFSKMFLVVPVRMYPEGDLPQSDTVRYDSEKYSFIYREEVIRLYEQHKTEGVYLVRGDLAVNGKTASHYADGLHLSDTGAGLLADAMQKEISYKM